jgi:WD40 repeat protein
VIVLASSACAGRKEWLVVVLHHEHGDGVSIYTVHPGSLRTTRIIDLPPADITDDLLTAVNLSLAWSPAGGHSAWIDYPDGLSPQDGYLYLINMQTGERQFVSPIYSGGFAESLAWFPNGSRLAFCGRSDGTASSVNILDVDSGQIQEIDPSVIGPFDCSEITSSSEGRYLAIPDFNDEIAIFDVEGNNLHARTRVRDIALGSHNMFCDLAWSPNASYLAFTHGGCSVVGLG